MRYEVWFPPGDRRHHTMGKRTGAMRASVKWGIGLVVVLAAALSLTATLSVFPFEREADAEEPDPVPALADGRYFAMVVVGKDETGSTTLGVDLAEMLSGEEARQAAVEDGVIGEDEDLPNDFYIRNPDKVYELMHTTEDAVFEMISGDDVSLTVDVDTGQLAALHQGSYVGEAIYGVVAGEPMAMDVMVSSGLVSGAKAVYLP